MAFGGRGSSYEWQKGLTGRDAPRRLEMPYDMLVRGLVGQMAEPPETAISVPLQQAISNLQSGNPALNFQPTGSMAARLAGGSTGSASGTGGGGFAPGSFLPGAPGGQQGLQTREQLGIPDRESYFPFTPTAEEIEQIGMAPIRTQVKGKQAKLDRIEKLENRIEKREAAGMLHKRADKRLEKVRKNLARQTDPSPRRGAY